MPSSQIKDMFHFHRSKTQRLAWIYPGMQNGNSFVLRNGNAMRWLGGAGDAVRISIKFSPPGPGPHSSDNSIPRDS